MKRHLRSSALSLVVAGLLVSACAANRPPVVSLPDISEDTWALSRDPATGLVTSGFSYDPGVIPMDTQNPVEGARRFLVDHANLFGVDDPTQLVLDSDTTEDGTRTILFRQELDGVEVLQTRAEVFYGVNGNLSLIQANVLAGLAALRGSRPAKSPAEAGVAATKDGFVPSGTPVLKIDNTPHGPGFVYLVRGVWNDDSAMAIVDGTTGEILARSGTTMEAVAIGTTTSLLPPNGLVSFPVRSFEGEFTLRNDRATYPDALKGGQGAAPSAIVGHSFVRDGISGTENVQSANKDDWHGSTPTTKDGQIATAEAYAYLLNAAKWFRTTFKEDLFPDSAPLQLILSDGLRASTSVDSPFRNCAAAGWTITREFRIFPPCDVATVARQKRWNGHEGIDVGTMPFNRSVVDTDTMAHEMAHAYFHDDALTPSRAGEDGHAIAEGLADIFSAFYERARTGQPRLSIMNREFPGHVGRDFVDPHRGVFAQPRHVRERYRGAADNGGSHDNAGIITAAFALMVAGGTSPESNITVEHPLTWDQALPLYLSIRTAKLPRGGRMVSLGHHLIAAAKERHIDPTPIACAWAAVGVFPDTDPALRQYSCPGARVASPEDEVLCAMRVGVYCMPDLSSGARLCDGVGAGSGYQCPTGEVCDSQYDGAPGQEIHCMNPCATLNDGVVCLPDEHAPYRKIGVECKGHRAVKDVPCK